MAVATIEEHAPSGPDLEYDDLFLDLMKAAHPGEAGAFKGSEADREPNAAEVIRRANAVLERSHDLRAAVLLGYGELLANGFPGFATATGYILGYLREYWDTCHPQLDAEDNDDPTMCCNAVLGLVDPDRILRAVRGAPLTDSAAFGRFSLRDIAIAEGEAARSADAEPADPSTIAAAFKDTPPDELARILEGARQALRDIEGINAIFDARLPGKGPNLEPLLKLLRRAVGRLAMELGAPEATDVSTVAEQAEEEAEMEDGASGAAPAPAAAAAPGELTCPRDVEQAIDRIIAYYKKHEPSSPVPILLGRARRLVGADFLTILKDIAPAGTDHVKLIGGLE